MRSYIIYFIIFLALLGVLPTKGLGEWDQSSSADYQVIPDDAIRLRILANSDGENDQELKRKIRDRVNNNITEWVKEIDDIEEARETIQNKLPQIKATVKTVLEEQGSHQSYQVDYGDRVNFPAKVYGSYIYPAGEYEAILITLGNGNGANWWCVLFPPLCFLDFSDGTTVAETDKETEEAEAEQVGEEEVEVKFFLFEWFS
ncbi:stage II sporulation protein R [Sediminibacillus albus]|uniref:Stage II sporulation protein R n=1 Tax=Sediminibacillus albus TaxID=407036 RepID=A0A1G8ZK44_9BACI|nr:stage II sporulation protein R [Sediminibacillus albus]SDK15446.1 stage II sporulation protein R [Sediminibacillus albus]